MTLFFLLSERNKMIFVNGNSQFIFAVRGLLKTLKSIFIMHIVYLEIVFYQIIIYSSPIF